MNIKTLQSGISNYDVVSLELIGLGEDYGKLGMYERDVDTTHLLQ